VKDLENKILAGYDAFFASYVSIDFILDTQAGDQPYLLAPIIAATSGFYKAYAQSINARITDACIFAAAGYLAAGLDAMERSNDIPHCVQGAAYVVIAGIYLWQQSLSDKTSVSYAD